MTSGSGLEARSQQAVPVHFQPLAGGVREAAEDEVARARRSRLRWQIACGVAFALAVASFGVVISSMVYEARASVMIRPPTGGSGAPQAVGSALQAEVEILQSSEVVRQALESIGVDVLYPGLGGETIGAVRATAVDRMRGALTARTLPGSSVIEVSFRHPEAQLAADVVNRVVERFRRSRPEVLTPVASERFLQGQIEEQREGLAAAEVSLAAFHAEHPELAAEDARRSLADRRVALEAELLEQRAAVDALHSARSSEDPSVLRARTRLDELELELQKTLGTHVEGSRAVSKLQSEIERVRDYQAQRERAATPEGGRRLELLRSRQNDLGAQLTELDQAERELPELERRARELARERDVVARRLDAYQRALEAATLEAEVDQHNIEVGVRVLESAQPPTAAMVPEEHARHAWALLGAALILLLGAFLMDVLDQPRAHRQPILWTPNVGASGEGSLVARLMPSAQHGLRDGPVVLLLAGDADGAAGRMRGASPEPRA